MLWYFSNGGMMETQVWVILAVATAGVAWVVYLMIAQLRRRRGDDLHQRRGVVILALLLFVLLVLERGLKGTAFKPDPMSFSIHMMFAIPTGIILSLVVLTGLLARKKGLAWAMKVHRLFNKPSGHGMMYWLSASILTGLIFLAVSLVHTAAT